MSCGIYKIENLVNGKIYIGQSIQIERRFARHKRECINEINEYPIYRAMRKYGVANFSFCILEECQQSDLNQREIYWIDYYDSFNPQKGYNLTLGGSHSKPKMLTLEIASKIKLLLLETDYTQEEIAIFFNISQRSVSSINTGETWFDESFQYPLRRFFNKQYFCSECGNEIAKRHTSDICFLCAMKKRRMIERPSAEQLEQELRELNFVQVGKKYGVSDNAVRKWCKSYGMSTSSKDYK